MAGKFLFHVIYFSYILSFGTVNLVYSSPVYSLPLTEQGKYSMNNNRVVVAEVDKPLDAVIEAVMELGGHILFLIPQKEFIELIANRLIFMGSEKRDPPGPDLGTGRSYSGQRTANVMWGQLASNSPTGPGRRKRNPIDGGGAAINSYDGDTHSISRTEDVLP